MVDTVADFSGAMPGHYDRCLGPAWFEALATDLAERLPPDPAGDVLEIACGTGLVTRRLRERLDPALQLVASDLSPGMLDYARRKLDNLSGIEWHEADAARLPFGDARFGAVVCAFGIMFVPDKRAAFSEARRVLKPNGILLFNVWDRIEDNPHALAGAVLLEGMFPGDPEMRFRAPYEMHDPRALGQMLDEAGFRVDRIEKKRIGVDRVSARTIAVGQIRGTPRSLLIEKRGVALEEVIDRLTAALVQIGGADPYRAQASAVVVQARA